MLVEKMSPPLKLDAVQPNHEMQMHNGFSPQFFHALRRHAFVVYALIPRAEEGAGWAANYPCRFGILNNSPRHSPIRTLGEVPVSAVRFESS